MLMGRRRDPAPLDLLAWPAIEAARAAEDARLEAAERLRLAPNGEILIRRGRFQEATQEALRAQLEAERALKGLDS